MRYNNSLLGESASNSIYDLADKTEQMYEIFDKKFDIGEDHEGIHPRFHWNWLPNERDHTWASIKTF